MTEERKREMAESQKKRDEFGEQLQERAEGQANLHLSPLRRLPNSLDVSSGTPGIQFTYMFRRHEVEIAVYLDSDWAESTHTFERLMGMQAVIEARFGEPLDWLPRKKRQVSRIRKIITTGGYLDEARWHDLQEEMIDVMARLCRAFGSYINSPYPTDYLPTADPDELGRRVGMLRTSSRMLRPTGQAAPEKVIGKRTVYSRDPRVIVWVLQTSQGRCELCAQPAPFIRADGEPYLEVHHVQGLAQGGPDTTENAVALCPNCHRQLHHAADADRQRERLYAQIGRLVRVGSNTRG